MTAFRCANLAESLGSLFLRVAFALAFFAPNVAQAAPHMGFVHLAEPNLTDTVAGAHALASPSNATGLCAEAARLSLQTRGIETVVAVASPAEAEQTIATIAAQGVEILVTSSPRLFHAARAVAPAYPDTLFFVRTDGPVPEDMSGYQLRSYEACYLAGVQTASQLQDAAAQPTTASAKASAAPDIHLYLTEKTAETVRNHNAFALGVRSILPDARVVLTRESTDASLEQLVLQTVTLDWHKVFASLLAQRRFGIWQGTGRTLWYGMDSGVIAIPKDTKNASRLAAAAKQIVDKNLFSGPLHDNTGQLRVLQGETLSDAQLSTVDWFLAGIIDSCDVR